MPAPEIVHLVQELREERVQTMRQDFVDAAILQIGQQPTARRWVSAEWSLASRFRFSTTSCRLACSDQGMSRRRMSRSATRPGVITSR